MLSFIRDHIISQDRKNEGFDDFFTYSNISKTGFPPYVSALALDSTDGLIALGTKYGQIKISSLDGCMFSTTLNPKFLISHIQFVPGARTMIIVCDEKQTNKQKFFRGKIFGNQLKLDIYSNEKHIKRALCFEFLNEHQNISSSIILFGTVTGNIYSLGIEKLEIDEYLIFWDSNLRRLPLEDRSIQKITVHPFESNKLFLLFSNKIIALYDRARDDLLSQHNASKNITDISYYPGDKSRVVLIVSHVDGTYCTLHSEPGNSEFTIDAIISPFQPFSCSKISKISVVPSIFKEDLIIFTDGVPIEEYGDRNTLTIFYSDQPTVFDFESRILDYSIFVKECKASLLFVLCCEELVVIDLENESWPSVFPPSSFYPLHTAPITTMAAIINVSAHIKELLMKISEAQMTSSKLYGRRVLSLSTSLRATQNDKHINVSDECDILLTGHENGCVNIWKTERNKINHFILINTAREFEGFEELSETDEQQFLKFPELELVRSEELLESKLETEENLDLKCSSKMDLNNGLTFALKKVGTSDPYYDDSRLTIQKIEFDRISGHLIVAGKSGQFMVYEGLTKSKMIQPPAIIIADMTESNKMDQNMCDQNQSRKNRPKGTAAIVARSKSAEFPAGFCLANNTLFQFKPATPITAIGWNKEYKLVAAGNEFGYAICSVALRQILYKTCLLTAADIQEIHGMSGALSRFKSVQKTIRQSFRRKKRTTNESTSRPIQPVLKEYRSTEREIMQRTLNPNVLGGETPNSLVKVTTFLRCNLSNSHMFGTDHLFVGTYGGLILIHSLSYNRITQKISTALLKEIRLHHRAPIVSISHLQDLFSSRIIVCTEEQIRFFNLPSLKPSHHKNRFTALEGSRIRRASIIMPRSLKLRRNAEKFVGILTNRGEIFIYSLTAQRRRTKLPYVEETNASGILSSFLVETGELYYLTPSLNEIVKGELVHNHR